MSGLLSGYQKSWLRFDAIAGVSSAAVVIPKSMALASIAGLPLQAGLYVALVPMVVYALLGTSRPLSVSSTSTIAMLTATALTLAVPGASPAQLLSAAATLALLVGGVLMMAGLLRLGFLANFMSDPVLAGFRAGIGLAIIVDQIPKLLGVHIGSGNFFHKVLATLQHIPETNRATLLLAAATMAMLIGLERFRPRFPAPLAAVIIGVAAAGFLGLHAVGVALTGAIPARIPAPQLPDFSLLKTLWPSALGIALMSFTESIAVGRTFARHDDPPLAPDRELIALGAANIAGSFFQSFPAGGGASQTAVNSRAGARTQVAELVTVAMVVATLLFLSSFISLLPQATLAAVVVVTSLPLLSTADFRSILRIRRMEFLWAIAAFAGVVVLGTLQGILVAIAISIVTLFYQANHPPVYALRRKPGTDVFRPWSSDHPEDETIPGLLIIKTEGRMNFASAPRAREHLAALIFEARPRVVIFECSAIPDFEYTALRALTHAEENMRAHGISLCLCALNPQALEAVRRSPLGEALGHARMFFNLRDAVKAYETRAQ
ncbi:MAG TPA: SulP family inorganic anion transporter [Steroidobacteraceae bacterium]|nr:SulP family inorganic anion transporter [Steroidobacteraceae bacterium]